MFEIFFGMSNKDVYTTGNLLDSLYNQNYYKLICINLSGQTNTSIPQQISLTEKLEKDNEATMVFITEKKMKTVLKLSLDSLIVTK